MNKIPHAVICGCMDAWMHGWIYACVNGCVCIDGWMLVWAWVLWEPSSSKQNERCFDMCIYCTLSLEPPKAFPRKILAAPNSLCSKPRSSSPALWSVQRTRSCQEQREQLSHTKKSVLREWIKGSALFYHGAEHYICQSSGLRFRKWESRVWVR